VKYFKESEMTVGDDVLMHYIDLQVAKAVRKLTAKCIELGLPPEETRERLKPILIEAIHTHFIKK